MVDEREIDLYRQYGYIPYDLDKSGENWSVSKTLEYAYDDWCIAKFAAGFWAKALMLTTLPEEPRTGAISSTRALLSSVLKIAKGYLSVRLTLKTIPLISARAMLGSTVGLYPTMYRDL